MNNDFGTLALQPWNRAVADGSDKPYLLQIKYDGYETTHTADFAIDGSNLLVLTLATGSESYTIEASAGGDVQIATLCELIDAINNYGLTSEGKGWKARRKDAFQAWNLEAAHDVVDGGVVVIEPLWTDACQTGAHADAHACKRLVNYDLAVMRPSDGTPRERKGLIQIGSISGTPGSGTESVVIRKDDGTEILTIACSSGVIATTSYFSFANPLTLRGPVVVESQGTNGPALINWRPVNP